MADWTKPELADAYANVLTEIIGLATDCGTLFNSAPSNQPDHVIRFLRSPGKFQEWLSASWNDLILDVTGGGTGSATASGARTNLGIGTLGTQSASSVVITGGSIAGTTLDAFGLSPTNGVAPAAALGTGTANSSTVLYGDGTWKSKVAPYTFLAKSANYVVTAADVQSKPIILCTNTINITLPDSQGTGANLIDGGELNVKNIDTTNITTILPHSGDTIDGAASIVIPNGFSGGKFNYTLICNKTSSRWEII